MEPGGIEPDENRPPQSRIVDSKCERATKRATYATPEFATVVEAWPDLPAEVRAAIATLAQTATPEALCTVGEPSPTAGPNLGHEDLPSVRQALADGRSSIVAEIEPGTGGDTFAGVRSGDARDAVRPRGNDRGPTAARSGAESGAP